MKTKKKSTRRMDYDSPWKEVIEKLFEDFIKFFFPDIYADINFKVKPQFLSGELRKLTRDAAVGKRYADVLVKVHLKDGTVRCIFIHIEVQGRKDEDLLDRIYVYNYRIRDHHRETNEEVVSLLILTDEDDNYRPSEFCKKRWRFELLMKVPMVKIIDYRDKLEELEKSDNPMALVVLAQLESHEAKKSADEKKYDVKLNLMKRCLRKGYTGSYIRRLFRFIDWVIALPQKYEQKLSREIVRLKEEIKMPYVASYEREWKKAGKREGIREGKREGMREGKQEGIREGMREGKQEGKRETAKKMLEDNFLIESIVKYTGLSEGEIKKLMN